MNGSRAIVASGKNVLIASKSICVNCKPRRKRMTASASDIATEERTLVITRVFDAPREFVFKMWSDPRHLLHWMGPREYPAMKVDNDFRVGGRWRIGLRSADGTEDLWQSGVYREIVE